MPPQSPAIELRPGDLAADDPVVRDDYGNARGGIRLPQLEAPTATLDGRRNQGATGTPGFATSTFCSDTPWRSIERRWRSLYPNHDAFVAKFSEAVDRLEQDGYLLKPEADQAKRAARESGIRH